MKILHITNNYPTPKHPIFGIFVKEQIDSLSKAGVKNEVFFINGREKGKLEYFMSIYKIHSLLRKNQFDVIHCHHAFSAVCFILSGHAKNNKTVVSYQNDPTNENGKRVFSFIQKRVNTIILKNNSTIVDNKTVFYQPNGVNIEFFKPIDSGKCKKKLNLDIQKKYILFVSSNFIREQKRYDRFKEILAILTEKYGFKNIEELKLINTKRELVPYYFNASSIHLLCSDFEGSPNSVKEAMSCNVPVVSTCVGNVSDLLNGVNGSFVSKTFSSEELAKLAYKVLTSQERLNSRNHLIEKKLDINSVAEKIITIYKSIKI